MIPCAAHLNMTSAVFPACLLPSVVSVWSYLSLVSIDILGVILKFRTLWWPAVQRRWLGVGADSRVDREEASARELAADSFSEADSDASGTISRDELKAIMIKGGHLLTDEGLDRAMAVLDRDGSGQVTYEEYFDWWEQLRLGDQDFEILLLIVDENIEIIVPLCIAVLEAFIYWGWNSAAVPTLAALSTADFVSSALVKLVFGATQAATCVAIAFFVNSFTQLKYWNVNAWIVHRYFPILLTMCVSEVVFCYSIAMPHFNFNVDVVAKVLQEGTGELITSGLPTNCVPILDGSSY